MYFIPQNHVKIAIARAGGPTRISNLLGIANGTVHSWIRAQRISNIQHASKLAELSKMTVQQLRPTL